MHFYPHHGAAPMYAPPVRLANGPTTPVATPVTRALSTHWENLVVLSFDAEAQAIRPHLPRGVDLDCFQGKAKLSLVGFQFRRTMLGMFTSDARCDFSEINLRTYVRDSEGTPGVVFLRELCPSRIGCILGRFLFNEKFQLCPTSFEIEAGDGKQTARYSFGKGKASSHLQIVASVRPSVVKAESEEAFVSQRYFGFSRQRDGSTLKFEVVHRPWVVYSATDVSHSVAAEPLYGKDLAGFLSGRPTSAFIMDGSAVEVLRHGRF